MDSTTLITPLTCIILFLFIASLASIWLKRINFPYTIGLVIIGIVVGILADQFQLLAPIDKIHLSTNLILYIIVPTLVFEAAVNIDSRLLVRNLMPVLVLAAPGLIKLTIAFILLFCY